MRHLILGFLVLAGCATTHENPSLNLLSEKEYFSEIENNTKKRQVYDGFTAVLEFSATLINTRTAMAQVDQNARIYQWSVDQYQNEKNKSSSDLAKETKVFLSFFVPDRKHDDLQKTNSKWKIFLDVGGKRYEGRATRLKSVFAELQALYPHQTRWNTPYLISFKVPTSVTETGKAKLTLTGAVTSASVEFDPL